VQRERVRIGQSTPGSRQKGLTPAGVIASRLVLALGRPCSIPGHGSSPWSEAASPSNQPVSATSAVSVRVEKCLAERPQRPLVDRQAVGEVPLDRSVRPAYLVQRRFQIIGTDSEEFAEEFRIAALGFEGV
jgi:hypothetical protein